LKGGEAPLAITKQKKNELVAQYTGLMDRSEGLIVTEYSGLNMKQIDELRGKVREAGGEFHIVKNTLSQVAFKDAGYPVSESMFQGSTAIVFAFKDAAGMAKIISDYSRTVDIVKIKGGYLGHSVMNSDQVKTLSELPPLPVIRAQLLGVLQAPAGKLVRTLAEPARSLAAVLKAYADQDSAAAEPTA
jgi:large subunit ribosomal protein L10